MPTGISNDENKIRQDFAQGKIGKKELLKENLLLIIRRERVPFMERLTAIKCHGNYGSSPSWLIVCFS